jgi:nucleoside-diphosphate-sugar epimerase
LHLAWCTEHGKFWNADENADWIDASVHLVRRFRAGGGGRAVVAGTCAEYDWTGDCCDESTAIRPATVYGNSKNVLRRLLEEYARSSGLSATWGRIFFAYGPGEQPTRLIPSVARALVAGESVDCTAGTQVRDLLYVEDLAAAFAALTDSVLTGAVDIGAGRGVALRDVILRLQRLAGGQNLVRFGRLPDRDEPRRIVAEAGRIRTELAWRPVYPLDAGLERTLSWWRAAAAEGGAAAAHPPADP